MINELCAVFNSEREGGGGALFVEPLIKNVPSGLSSLCDKNDLPTRDSRPDSNVSFIQRFYCTTRDSRPDPNVSFIQRFHCAIRDSRPDPNVSFIQRFYCTTRDSRPDLNSEVPLLL